jgi:hypothetical protein
MFKKEPGRLTKEAKLAKRNQLAGVILSLAFESSTSRRDSNVAPSTTSEVTPYVSSTTVPPSAPLPTPVLPPTNPKKPRKEKEKLTKEAKLAKRNHLAGVVLSSTFEFSDAPQTSSNRAKNLPRPP